MGVTGLVLAAGSSRRLGQPKQVLPFRGRTLLDATLETARRCGFDQLLVTLGGAGELVREQVDLDGVEVVDAPDFGTGCSASIRAALGRTAPDSDGLVLLLGDQPAVRREAVSALLECARDGELGVTRYAGAGTEQPAWGHPMWFARSMFSALAAMHGDKAIWKLLHSGDYPVIESPRAGIVPIDVDTWDDYERLLAMAAP